MSVLHGVDTEAPLAEILKVFPSGVEVDGEATPHVSGWLEVEIVYPKEKTKLLHSKKNGQGSSKLEECDDVVRG